MKKREKLENFCKGKKRNGDLFQRMLLNENRAELKGMNYVKDKAINKFEREYIKLIRKVGNKCPTAYQMIQEFSERYKKYLEEL